MVEVAGACPISPYPIGSIRNSKGCGVVSDFLALALLTIKQAAPKGKLN
jgi:hypothetical protein